jgi:hypothetical protein
MAMVQSWLPPCETVVVRLAALAELKRQIKLNSCKEQQTKAMNEHWRTLSPQMYRNAINLHVVKIN